MGLPLSIAALLGAEHAGLLLCLPDEQHAFFRLECREVRLRGLIFPLHPIDRFQFERSWRARPMWPPTARGSITQGAGVQPLPAPGARGLVTPSNQAGCEIFPVPAGIFPLGVRARCEKSLGAFYRDSVVRWRVKSDPWRSR
jgi:hypothetical protein